MESLKKKMRKKMRMKMEMGILYLCSLSSFSLLCFRLKKKNCIFFFFSLFSFGFGCGGRERVKVILWMCYLIQKREKEIEKKTQVRFFIFYFINIIFAS